jgi:hypothetical protein
MAALAQSLPIERREAALALFRKLLSSLGETEITVNVPVDHIICQTCDSLRAADKHEDVRVIEELVQVLKGEQPRLIQGAFQLNARNLADVDNQLEALRRVLVRS